MEFQDTCRIINRHCEWTIFWRNESVNIFDNDLASIAAEQNVPKHLLRVLMMMMSCPHTLECQCLWSTCLRPCDMGCCRCANCSLIDTHQETVYSILSLRVSFEKQYGISVDFCVKVVKLIMCCCKVYHSDAQILYIIIIFAHFFFNISIDFVRHIRKCIKHIVYVWPLKISRTAARDVERNNISRTSNIKYE